MRTDRVGIGWRPDLTAGIFDALDEIDIIEVIADNFLTASRRQRQALRMMARQVPLHLHGLGLGMAGTEVVETKRLDGMARLINQIEPEAWSEHLAFVRAGGTEIGHLAAPPRTEASVAGAARNLRKAESIVGSLPMMENIATLIEPPLSELSEQHWVSAIADASGCELLLDIHNLHANATNFSFDPVNFLLELPLNRISCIHIAGGQWINSPDTGERYLLDDHLHDVPSEVYNLLAEVAARVPQPLTVILERDGAYPPIPFLIDELRRARSALEAGRRQNQCRVANAG